VSDTFLTTYSILISEFLIILIAVVVFLIYKLRSQRVALREKRKVVSTIQDNLLPYLHSLITSTESRLKESPDINDPQRNALQQRLKFLFSQHELLSKQGNGFNKDAYWKLVENEYIARGTIEENPEMSSTKEHVYISRIENLEGFKKLFFETEEKLVESFKTIEELHALTSQQPIADLDTLKEKVHKLETEKNTLKETLIKTSEKLKESESQIQKSEPPTDVSELKEENDFLCKQIEHLLEQEVYASKKMIENIAELENALHEKEAECQRLSSQLQSKTKTS